MRTMTSEHNGEDMTTAIGIARQSHGDGASVEEQAERIRAHAKREGWDLLAVLPEQDVSGGKPLDKRPGLSKAVEAVEAGRASIIVVAYFDRLVRSVRVQHEVTERVEAAGGRIVTLDVGEVSSATAASWLSASFLGTVAEYHRRATSERVKSAHERRKSAGLWNGGRLPFYRALDADGRVTWADEATLSIVGDAFKLRATGVSVADVLDMLRERTGLPLKSLNICQRMLQDEALIGVAVDGATFRRVQSLRTKRGARPKSDRLLARLDVLTCSECGGFLNVHGSDDPAKGRVQTYRCHRGHGAISCDIAESTVAHAVRCALRDFRGHAGSSLEELEANVAERNAQLERAVVALTDFSDTDAVRSKLAVLKGELDAAEDELADARRAAGFELSPSLDWNMLSMTQKREIVRGVVKRATVRPGRGHTEASVEPATGETLRISDRIEIELSETFAVGRVLDEAARDVRVELREVAA
jgi:DNA invertase Pin-like site-specific DNA recombinase